MNKLKSTLILEHDFIRLLLFKKSNGIFTYFDKVEVGYEGFSAKGFVNPDDTFSKIQSLFAEGERYGRIEKNSLVILPGMYFKYADIEEDVTLGGSTVSNNDVINLLKKCDARLPSYEKVQVTPLKYKTATNPNLYNPVGEKTERLRVLASVELLKTGLKELFDNCAKRLKKKFYYTSPLTVIAKKTYFDKIDSNRIVIYFADGHIDVGVFSGGVNVLSKSDLFGCKYLSEGLSYELDCDIDVAEKIALGSNLNLNFSSKDKYYFGTGFSVSQVNSLLAEGIIYIAKEVRECILGLTEEKFPIYMAGSDLCQVRGIKELFEDEIGRDITLLKGKEHNQESCAKYFIEALTDRYNYEKDIFFRA